MDSCAVFKAIYRGGEVADLILCYHRLYYTYWLAARHGGLQVRERLIVMVLFVGRTVQGANGGIVCACCV